VRLDRKRAVDSLGSPVSWHDLVTTFTSRWPTSTDGQAAHVCYFDGALSPRWHLAQSLIAANATSPL
jgi:hypothetical protein